jgi:hypothetical protein
MSTETEKYEIQPGDGETRHSALEEFARDERRPAVLLLGALIIAAIFFALGIIFDRWTINRNIPSNAPLRTTQTSQTINSKGQARRALEQVQLEQVRVRKI